MSCRLELALKAVQALMTRPDLLWLEFVFRFHVTEKCAVTSELERKKARESIHYNVIAINR